MKRPTVTTRFIGKPRVALVLYIGVGLNLFGWMQGAVPWWLGIMALCFVGTVRNAVRQLRHYNAWVAEWQAMGGCDEPAVKRAKVPASRGKLLTQVVGFALLAWGLWNVIPAGQNPSPVYIGLIFLLVSACLWKTGRLLASVLRSPGRSTAPAKVPAAMAESDFVEWTLPAASSSPSRAEITRTLPEYAAQLLTPSSGDSYISAGGKRPC